MTTNNLKNGMLGEGKRIGYIDAFRFFGILMMVMGHIGFGKTFDHFIHAFHMPMFFFISGLFFVPSRSFRDELSKRFKTLLLPYIFFGALNYIVWVLLNPAEDPYLPLKHLAFENTINIPIAGALWFLTAFFLTVILYRIISKIFKDKLLWVIVIILALLGCMLKEYLQIRLPYALDAALVGIGLYHVGAELAKRRSLYNKITSLHPGISILLAIVSVVLTFVNGYINMRNGSYGIIPLFWLNAFVCCIAGLNLSRLIYNRMAEKRLSMYAKRYIGSVGENAIVYICLNQLLIGVVFQREEHPGHISGLIILVFTMAILWLISLLFSGTGLRVVLGRDILYGNFWRIGICIICFLSIGVTLFAHFGFGKNVTSVEKEENAVVEESVSTPDWDSIDTRLLTAEEYEDAPTLISLMQNHMKYMLDEQWNLENPYAISENTNTSQVLSLSEEEYKAIRSSRDSFVNWKNEETLNIVGYENSLENAIRPWAHLCYSASIELRFGVYQNVDNKTIMEEAEAKTIKLISSLARRHISNDEKGWGDTWQSALWAENIGFAAWLMWDELGSDDRVSVCNMVIHEADRFLDYEVRYYKDRDGNVLYEGDTKGEENAWNSKILALASCMFPDHKSCSEWENKMTELLLSSTAMPGDWKRKEAIDGFSLSGLQGSNVNEDGTVINHGLYHIDYSATIAEGMLDCMLIYSLAGKEIPHSSMFNVDKMYSALVNVDLGIYDPEMDKQHFYVQKDGKPTAEVKMPGENDWGGNWYASYYLMDTEAEIFHLDDECPDGCSASDWADVHLDRLSEMASRETNGRVTGCFFKDGENYFVSGETYQLHNLSKAYLLRRLFFNDR